MILRAGDSFKKPIKAGPGRRIVKIHVHLRIFAALLATLFCADSHAQSFPSKPLKIIVPYTAGGLMDLMGRQIGRALADDLRQSVVIENIPGASGAIGITNVKNASPDGHTIILLEPGVVIAPLLDPTTGFYVQRDLDPVAIVAEAPLILGVNAAVPARTLSEFIELLRSRPGEFNFASPGIGTSIHMASELFKAQTGVNIVHVPYRGVAAAFTDLLSGRVQMIFLGASDLKAYVQDGRMRALASAGPHRSRTLPELPSLFEAGYRNVQVTTWIGLFVAKGTPQVALDRLRRAVTTVLGTVEFQQVLAQNDFEQINLSGADAQRFVDQEEKKWGEVVSANKLK